MKVEEDFVRCLLSKSEKCLKGLAPALQVSDTEEVEVEKRFW
jgi:hypothetical protein